jgi:hypothetical protein
VGAPFTSTKKRPEETDTRRSGWVVFRPSPSQDPKKNSERERERERESEREIFNSIFMTQSVVNILTYKENAARAAR